MTYAYDDYVQMPTKDLYDTAVMKMAIEAAKDMYDKGQAQMENFYKTYGDFMSPFAADMQKYGAAMDYVRKTVNDAYARGIDLFKSPEGRAIVAQLSHSIDPGWYNRARANAKVGYAYLDSLKEAMKNGTYDRDFQNFVLSKENGGPGTFEDFSSDNGMWNISGVSKFQDLNQWTHHLFDNMQLTYDPELSKATPGFLAYSKNKDVMNQIAANNMATLANTDMGKYMIDRYAQQFKARGYSDDKALEAAFDMLQRNIVNANYEQSQVKLEQDPYAYLQQSKAADLENFRQKELIKQQITMDLNGDGVVSDEERELYYGALKKQLEGDTKEPVPNGTSDQLANEQILRTQNRRNEALKGVKTKEDLKKAQEKWYRENSTGGMVGRTPTSSKPSTEAELRRNSEDIFKRNNVVTLQQGQQEDMNSLLAHKTDPNTGEVYNYVDHTVDFRPNVVASMTGNRVYTYNSVVNKVSRAIKGKKYTVPAGEINREYASGTRNKKRVNVINETVIFKDKDVVEKLDKINEDTLNSFGIEKLEDGYKIPISHTFNANSIAAAAVNSATDKRVAGQSEAAKRQANRQARAYTGMVENK